MDTNLGQVLLVKDINDSERFFTDSDPSYLIELNDKLYFAANDAESGRELFVTDGTVEGTQLVADIAPGLDGSNPNYLIEFNNKLYFRADNGESGNELFVSDGTAEGTQLLVDLRPGSDNSSFSLNYNSNPRNFFELNDKLYFTANNGENGRELFVTDGTAEGTQLLVDINPDSDDDSYPYILAEIDNKLYLVADDGENGRELFVSDGTAEGTQLLVDLRPGSSPSGRGYGSYPSFVTKLNNKLYFTANNGEVGRELFVTDGTAEGTQLLVDLRPGLAGSNPFDLTEFNNKLYFGADNGEVGQELFVTDGTTEGTQLVADINTRNRFFAESSDPYRFTEFNNKLYFTADDGENGRELFVTDGTAEGTQLVADINAVSSGREPDSTPSGFAIFRDELFFAADDEEVGRELFKLTFDDTVVIQAQPLNLNFGTESSDEITGESTNDGITSRAGNDTINGLSGNDAIDGGAGNDILDGGGGIDTAVYQFAPGAVTVSLGEGSDLGMAMDGYGTTDSLSNIENIIGSELDDNLTGNSGNNSLTGRNGSDTIAGLGGDDFLTGSAGADTISGGSGSDRFVYLNPGEGGDTITDFAVGVDKILVLSVEFGSGLSAGELPANQFALGSSATSSQQRFVFDDNSSELFFDADGSGGVDQELIATLDGVSNLSAGDIMLL